jgi:hypothetical protein
MGFEAMLVVCCATSGSFERDRGGDVAPDDPQPGKVG